jgi:hypothetical protein
MQRLEVENPAWEASDSTLVSAASAFAIMGGNSIAKSRTIELTSIVRAFYGRHSNGSIFRSPL